MAQDKFNAKAETTDLSMLLKKIQYMEKIAPPTLQVNWHVAAETLGFNCWRTAAAQLVDIQMTGFQINWKNWLWGKVFNIWKEFNPSYENSDVDLGR